MITPSLADDSDAHALLHRVDGLVLTGGEDVDPARYGAAPHPKLGAVARERDGWEIALVFGAFADAVRTSRLSAPHTVI